MVNAAKIQISGETAKGSRAADGAHGVCLLADGAEGVNCGKEKERGPLRASFFGFQRFTGIRTVFSPLIPENSRPIPARPKRL